MSNPYIDYNLLKCQSRFSTTENKKFEHRHTISLKATDISVTENNKTKSNGKSNPFMRFKWDDRFTSKYECDTKHLLYLIYLSLIKVEERQKFKNKYYLQINRSDRILKLLDKEAIMTNLIEWYHKDIENNKLDGILFKTLGPKDFINNILTKYGGKQCTMGWSTKIYANLTKITINNISGNVFIPNYKYNKLKSDIIQWHKYSTENIIKLFKYAFRKTKQYYFTNYILTNYENDIVAFWIDKKHIVHSMKQTDLLMEILKYLCSETDKILELQLTKLIDILLMECDLNDML